MSAVLVRRHEIERADRPAGAFDQHQYGRGLVPPMLFGSIGVHCVNTAEAVFTLTYDDGPDPNHTPAILDVLRRYSAPATFFVLSDAAARHPEIIERIVADGHELALHGDTHQSLLTMSPRQAIDRIRRARGIVEDIAGHRIRLYRPPYGEHSFAQARAIRRAGLELTLWSADAADWLDGTEAQISDRALSGVFPGSILLLHDTRADPETIQPGERLPTFDRADVLHRILARTQADNFTPVTAGALLARYPHVKTVIRERMTPK